MDGNDIKMRALEVKIISLDECFSNDYNPNRMPEKLLDLLCTAIKKYGFLFPLIVSWDEEKGKYRIIDGYHRYEALKRIGVTEVAVIDMNISYNESVQLTVLMNRIKGFHQVELMSDLVVKLEDLGLEDDEIRSNLGMEVEEYLRLKQQLGIAHAFRDHQYSKSWKME